MDAKLNRIREKGIRWGRQQYRIEVVYIILRCFSHYYMMKDYVLCSRHVTNYKDACSLSDSVNKIFQLDSKPEDFMKGENEYVDKALDEYSQLQDLLNHYFPSNRYPIDIETIKSVLAHLYQHNILLKMKHIDYLFFIQYVEYVYHTRLEGVEYLKSRCLETMIWCGVRVRRIDSMHFRKTFIYIENVLEEINNKRLIRKKKRDEANI